MSKVNLISKEDAIKKIESSISSIYSKEDVLNLIKSINDNTTVEDENLFTKKEVLEILERAKGAATDAVDYLDIEDICNLDSIELTLEGREIYIDTNSVDIDSSEIQTRIEDAIDEVINDYQ